MGAFGGLILTNDGRALQAKAQAGTTLNFTRMGIGDGSLNGQSISNLKALISEKKSLAITKLSPQSTDKAVVGAVLSNQDVSTGFYFREIGVFAQDPDIGEILFCYGNAGAGAEYIPASGGADIIEKNIDVVTIVGNAANVSATIDNSLVYIAESEKGTANGVATLDNTGQVPANQLGNVPDAPVTSVNSKTGVITLTAGDVGADPAGSAATAENNAKNYTDQQVGAISLTASNITSTDGNVQSDIDSLKLFADDFQSTGGSIASAIVGKGGTLVDGDSDGYYTEQEMVDGVNGIKVGKYDVGDLIPVNSVGLNNLADVFRLPNVVNQFIWGLYIDYPNDRMFIMRNQANDTTRNYMYVHDLTTGAEIASVFLNNTYADSRNCEYDWEIKLSQDGDTLYIPTPMDFLKYKISTNTLSGNSVISGVKSEQFHVQPEYGHAIETNGFQIKGYDITRSDNQNYMTIDATLTGLGYGTGPSYYRAFQVGIDRYAFPYFKDSSNGIVGIMEIDSANGLLKDVTVSSGGSWWTSNGMEMVYADFTYYYVRNRNRLNRIRRSDGMWIESAYCDYGKVRYLEDSNVFVQTRYGYDIKVIDNNGDIFTVYDMQVSKFMETEQMHLLLGIMPDPRIQNPDLTKDLWLPYAWNTCTSLNIDPAEYEEGWILGSYLKLNN